ncbi:MAG: hypothetical protein LBU39_06490 [Desulfobulbaceae bacterium]|jgi:zinc resistance-associated protein|nr:hypothetical protein [Desulfobulbaceae bacterium]
MTTKSILFLAAALFGLTIMSPTLASAEVAAQVLAGAAAASDQARLLMVSQSGVSAPVMLRSVGGQSGGGADGIQNVVVGQIGSPPYVWQQLDPESQKIKDKFLTETVASRRSLAEKKAALRAMYSSGKADTALASRLAGEIFDLREQLRVEARKTGLPDNMLFSMPIDPDYTGDEARQ